MNLFCGVQLPQTFSHWTWEASGHRLCVVDIQGVGDCYTDPQVSLADIVYQNQRRLQSRRYSRVSKTFASPPTSQIHSIEGSSFGNGNIGAQASAFPPSFAPPDLNPTTT